MNSARKKKTFPLFHGQHYSCEQTTDHIKLSKTFMHRAGKTCWQMLRDELWLVRRGGCFRIPHRAVSRGACWRGGLSRLCRNLFGHSLRNKRPIAREQGCLTCSSVRRSDWCVSSHLWMTPFRRDALEFGDSGIYWFGRETKRTLGSRS